MKNAFVQATFFDANLQKLFSTGQNLKLGISWIKTLGREGTAVVTLPTNAIDFNTMTQRGLGMIIEVAHGGESAKIDHGTFWLLEKFSESGGTQQTQTLRLTFKDAISILGNTVVSHKDNIPVGSSPFGSINNVPANVALVEVVRQNLSDLAETYRNASPHITVQNPSALAPIISKPISGRKLLSIFQQIARASRSAGFPLYFDFTAEITRQNLRLVFTTYLNHRGVDRTAQGNIRTTDPAFILDNFSGTYTSPNRTFVGGSGRGVTRPLIRVESPEASLGPFTRIENFVSLQSGSIQEMEVAGQADINGNAFINTLSGNLVGDNAFAYGLGDLLAIEHRGEIYLCEIVSVRSNLENELYTRKLTIASRGDVTTTIS